jgi:hypothetical protein
MAKDDRWRTPQGVRRVYLVPLAEQVQEIISQVA